MNKSIRLELKVAHLPWGWKFYKVIESSPHPPTWEVSQGGDVCGVGEEEEAEDGTQVHLSPLIGPDHGGQCGQSHDLTPEYCSPGDVMGVLIDGAISGYVYGWLSAAPEWWDQWHHPAPSASSAILTQTSAIHSPSPDHTARGGFRPTRTFPPPTSTLRSVHRAWRAAAIYWSPWVYHSALRSSDNDYYWHTFVTLLCCTILYDHGTNTYRIVHSLIMTLPSHMVR